MSPTTASAEDVSDPTAAGAEHVDVFIVGAGLSGVDAAHHLLTACPWASFAIVESRSRIGGTWDLFRYPGIRSDSDMFTFSFPWKPWPKDRTIGQGAEIRQYLEDAAREDGTLEKIRFRERLVRSEWSSEDNRWTLTIERLGDDDEATGTYEMTAGFIISCTGYYRYDQGYLPDWDGVEDYQGLLIHPQAWPEDADLTDKAIVVIGSGATAVTLVPELAKVSSKVTMLQRSPTYMVSLPTTSPLTKAMRTVLPRRMQGGALRWQNAMVSQGMYKVSRWQPSLVKRVLTAGVRRQLPPGFDVETHFTPYYDPWDQRLCVVTDGDLFKAIKSGRVQMATDHIERFTPNGLRLTSGEHLDADVIITATGLDVLIGGGNELFVDGEKVDPAAHLTYKGCMLDGVPNMALVVGYANASWTLKADLTCGFVARMLNHLRSTGTRRVTAVNRSGQVSDGNMMGLTSGYLARAEDRLPRQGKAYPWRNYQSYLRDYRALRRSGVVDDTLEYA